MLKTKKYINSDHIVQTVVNVALFLFLIIEAYPMLYVLSCSLSEGAAVTTGKIVLLPKGLNIDGYRYVLSNKEIWIGYANTIFYTVVGTCWSLFVTLPCAYALSRPNLAGKRFVMIFFMITMYISGGLIPSYLNAKSLGLLDTRLCIILMGSLSVYNLIVARTFFQSSVPNEIIEAAIIDGCDQFKIFGKIVLPISKAIITVMALYYGVARWNSYFTEMIYLDDRAKFPLQLFLRELLLKAESINSMVSSGAFTGAELAYYQNVMNSTELLKYCVIVVSTLPMLIVYPKLQKYFEKGIMIGSVKG